MTKQDFRTRLSGLFIEQVSGLRDDVAIQVDQLLERFEDEAIAHGMTISAEIAKSWEYAESNDAAKDILTARDNKVWRKE